MLNANIKFKIFDKTFPDCSHLYATYRFTDDAKLREVNANLKAVSHSLAAENVLVINEIHGTTVVDADLMTDYSITPEADAAVTSTRGLVLTIQSADCVPVLLASHDGKVIGAAHCGWRSAKDNILINLVTMMRNKGATEITAIIGPAIHQESYEVDSNFYKAIIASEKDAVSFFIPSTKQNHYMFDLPAFVQLKLTKLGITDILNCCENTYTNPEKYFSYRRDVHLNLPGNKTNILSAIVIK